MGERLDAVDDVLDAIAPTWSPAITLGPPLDVPQVGAPTEPVAHEVRISSGYPASVTIEDTRTTYVDAGHDVWRVLGEMASDVSAHSPRRVVMSGADWRVEIEAATTMTADERDFHTDASLVARLDGTEVFARRVDRRDHSRRLLSGGFDGCAC